MTWLELKASLALWKRKRKYREEKRRKYYKMTGAQRRRAGITEEERQNLIAKWIKLEREAVAMVRLRQRQLAKEASERYPKNLPKKYRWAWDHPYKLRPRLNHGFRSWLDNNGYLTPNFTKQEARCKCGEWVPKSLLTRARNHAFNLEQLKHELGDVPVPVLSWYRPRWYNQQIGGATNSQHIDAVATDHSREWVEKVGRANFDRAADKVFRNGGVGRYPAGSVHVDTRGWRARWTTF